MNERRLRMLGIIRELAAEFLRREANPNPLITVTSADVSPDFRRATVFVTTYPADKEGDALIFLRRRAGDFKSFAKKHGRFKTVPHFDFQIDYGERNRQHIDEIANGG